MAFLGLNSYGHIKKMECGLALFEGIALRADLLAHGQAPIEFLEMRRHPGTTGFLQSDKPISLHLPFPHDTAASVKCPSQPILLDPCWMRHQLTLPYQLFGQGPKFLRILIIFRQRRMMKTKLIIRPLPSLNIPLKPC